MDDRIDKARHSPINVAAPTMSAKEVDYQGPGRQATTRRMSWAHLRSARYHGDPAWANACEALRSEASSWGRVDTGGALHGHEIPALGHVPRRDLGDNTGD